MCSNIYLPSSVQFVCKGLLVQAMKRSRTFQSSASDDAVAAQKVLGFIKCFTPATWILEALQGQPLYYNRESDFADLEPLVKELVSFDPYIKKSTLEVALGYLDKEHKGNLSRHKPLCQLLPWEKQEAFVLKELVMKNLKKAHNSNRWSRPRNIDTVVQALLGRKEDEPQETPTPKTTSDTWTEKHKRLLRRRSSEAEVMSVRGPCHPRLDQPGPDSQDTRTKILALYGVTDSTSSGDKGHEGNDTVPVDVVDLTLSPSPKEKNSVPIEEATPGRRSKTYFDMHRNKVVRVYTDGTLEEANTEEGPDGFLRGVFDDGFVFITEVPNITKGLPTRKALKEEDDMKKKAEREEKKEAKAKAKAEAKKKQWMGQQRKRMRHKERGMQRQRQRQKQRQRQRHRQKQRQSQT
jgi:hypothetical protein